MINLEMGHFIPYDSIFYNVGWMRCAYPPYINYYSDNL